MTSFPPTPEDWERVEPVLQQIREEAQARHDRAILLGYHEVAGIGDSLAVGFVMPQSGMDITWHIWRLDQAADTAQVLRSVAAVDNYFADVSTLPRYYLELEGNPRIDVASPDDDTEVRITDTESGEHFTLKRDDLDGFTIRSTGAPRLYVHADSAPTIGNWIPE